MFYWSPWTTISTTIAGTREARDTDNTSKDLASGQIVKREPRPVIVVRKSNTQIQADTAAYQPNRTRGRATPPRISLDVRRQTFAYTSSTRVYSSTDWHPGATTQTVLVK